MNVICVSCNSNETTVISFTGEITVNNLIKNITTEYTKCKNCSAIFPTKDQLARNNNTIDNL